MVAFGLLAGAQQTADIIWQLKSNAELRTHSGLQERSFGNLEGLSNTLMYEFENQEIQNQVSKFNGYAKLNVEPKEDFINRVSNAVNEIMSIINSGQKLLVIAHGRVFNVICELLNVDKIKQIDHRKIATFIQKEETVEWILNWIKL